jgi:pentatricopeptide repeat-containing protein PET309
VDRTPVESPFLDFLYPPQALALLHRHGSHHLERWERRNERRLPKGFVQANRRYSSKAEGRTSTSEMSDSNGDIADSRHDGRVEFESDAAYPGYVAQILDGSQDNNAELAHLETAVREGDLEDFSSADSPGELAEKAEMTVSIKASKDLRYLIENPGEGVAFEPERSLEYTNFAWSLFEKSRPKDRSDVSLKIKFLEWLSFHRNEAAETHGLELYHSIPAKRRTLAVYKAALPVFIRSGLYGLAEQGHAEALDQLENGHEVSVWLCSTAIENEMWDLASRVKHQLDVKYGGQAKDWVENLFWRQIAEIPSLLLKAINLSKHCRMLNQADAMTSKFDAFSTGMYKVAIVQQFTKSYEPDKRKRRRGLSRAEKTLNDGRIRYLIARIQLTNARSPDFLQDVLHALIDDDSKVHYPDAHKTVSYMYRQFQSMGKRIPGLLYFALLKRVVEYTDTPAGRWQQSWYISPFTLEQDYVRRCGKMHIAMHRWLITHYAAHGNVERVQYCYEGLLAEYPLYSDHKSISWNLVYVHARKGEVKQAMSAFEALQASATAAGDELDLRVWNMLLHTHSRAGDLDGGLDVMRRLLAAGYKPNHYSFHPLTELYASRGDVDSVLDLLEQYDDLSGLPRSTELYGSLMTAHIKAHDVKSARKTLEELIPKVRAGEVEGDLTKCFNILLTGLALHREVDKTMRAYRWMKDEKIRVDSMTYAALMQALAAYSQADAAWKILDSTMPEKGLRPTAFHYSVVMTGFVRQRAFKTALDIHAKMISRNIKPSLNTNAIYIKAKAFHEVGDGQRRDDNPANHSLELIVEELRDIFRDPSAGFAAHEPKSLSSMEDYSPQALLIGNLMTVYGAARSFEAVQTLVEMYTRTQQTDESGVTNEPLPLRILGTVMLSYAQASNWEEVERCWKLAKQQADAISIRTPVPRFVSGSVVETGPDILRLPVEETTSEIAKPVSLLSKRKPQDPSRPAPALRHILSHPLRHHITALAFQARFSEMISTVASVLGQGYTLDNGTWNCFIQQLLQSSPPLALLAFRLTERYLIPSFPGWIRGKPTANLSAYKQGLQYIRARHLRPNQLMPLYKTLVKLAAGLIEVRRAESLGLTSAKRKFTANGSENLTKYVGNMKLIRQHAPRTLHAVQTMPTVEDNLQTRFLRRQYQI